MKFMRRILRRKLMSRFSQLVEFTHDKSIPYMDGYGATYRASLGNTMLLCWSGECLYKK